MKRTERNQRTVGTGFPTRWIGNTPAPRSEPSHPGQLLRFTPVNCYALPGQLLRLARSTVTISPVNCYVLALIPTQNRLYRHPTPTSTEEGEGCGGRAPLIPRPHTPSIMIHYRVTVRQGPRDSGHRSRGKNRTASQLDYRYGGAVGQQRRPIVKGQLGSGERLSPCAWEHPLLPRLPAAPARRPHHQRPLVLAPRHVDGATLRAGPTGVRNLAAATDVRHGRSQHLTGSRPR